MNVGKFHTVMGWISILILGAMLAVVMMAGV